MEWKERYTRTMIDVFEAALKEYTSISMKSDRMAGAPCVADSRIPVAVLDSLWHYGSIEGVLVSSPGLTLQQVEDAIRFASIVIECPISPNTTPESEGK